jgi:hypothetical protein
MVCHPPPPPSNCSDPRVRELAHELAHELDPLLFLSFSLSVVQMRRERLV